MLLAVVVLLGHDDWPQGSPDGFTCLCSWSPPPSVCGLFYVQHQFEETYWHEHADWSYFEAALQGSSHLVLPRPLQWITASIGIHHVHHLSARIPNYRLQECLNENPELQHATSDHHLGGDQDVCGFPSGTRTPGASSAFGRHGARADSSHIPSTPPREVSAVSTALMASTV